MPTKRYKLLKDHPYAEKGALLELSSTEGDMLCLDFFNGELTLYVFIPITSKDTWLEEVKEEVMFNREQIEALQALIDSKRFPHNSDRCGWAISECILEDFLEAHASKEE